MDSGPGRHSHHDPARHRPDRLLFPRPARMKKRGVGRPTKLTKTFLVVAKDVLNEDINCIIYTDEELLGEINSRLGEKQRVGTSTFERWKAADNTDPIGVQFRGLIKKALRKQKQNL